MESQCSSEYCIENSPSSVMFSEVMQSARDELRRIQEGKRGGGKVGGAGEVAGLNDELRWFVLEGEEVIEDCDGTFEVTQG